MKTTVSFSDFTKAFHDMNRQDNFSYDGLRTLYDFLIEMEEDTGEEMELDVIAICCDFNELSLSEVINQYSIDISEANDDVAEVSELVEEYLNGHTILIGQTDSGTFVYQAF